MQQAVNRDPDASNRRATRIDACRDGGFRSVNVDLIYGLPQQTATGFARTLDR